MNDNMKIKYFDEELEVYDERRVVNKNTYSITLNYVPSPTRPLTVENGKTTLTETNGTPNANQYVLDRENGLLLFNQAMKGKVVTINYSAIGLWCISADKVYTNVDNKGKIVETLEDLMKENRQAIESIKTVGDASTVITQLQANIDSVTGLVGNIAEGSSVNEELTKSITSGKGTNITLTNTISSANNKINEMNTWVNQHGDIVNLDNRVDTVETEIPKINEQLEHKANEVFIEEFNGSNDTKKINNAINKLKLTGGVIRLKSKTYLFDNVIVPENINVIGTINTVLQPTTNSNPILKFTGNNHILANVTVNDNNYSTQGIVFGDFGQTSDIVQVKNIKVNNVTVNLKNKNNKGISIASCENVRVENCFINNINKATTDNNYSFGIVVHSDGTNVCKNVTIKDNNISGFHTGIKMWGTGIRNTIVITNNIVNDSAYIGIDGYHGGKLTVIKNVIKNATIGIFGDTLSVDNDNGSGTIISNNQIYGCTRFGVYFEELSNGLVSDNTIYNCGYGLYGGAGVRNTLFTNNTITYGTIGILISNEHTPSTMLSFDNVDSKISNNVIAYNTQTGIRLCGVRGLWQVESNEIRSNNTSNGDYYAIELLNDIVDTRNRLCDSVIICNNVISNYSISKGYQKGIKNSDTMTNLIIKDNTFGNNSPELSLNKVNAVITSNIFLDYNSTYSITNCYPVYYANIGLFEGNITNQAKYGLRFVGGVGTVEELSTDENTERGRIVRVNRDSSATHGDQLMYFKRLANGNYKWVELLTSE